MAIDPLKDPDDAKLPDKNELELKNVRFAYDASQDVLNGVSFTARQGEVTALIGPSGSGKTTVSRLVSRFWDISFGTITVGGMDISQIDPETLMSLYCLWRFLQAYEIYPGICT